MITALIVRSFLAVALVVVVTAVGLVLVQAANLFGAGLFLGATPFLFVIIARLLRKTA